MIMFWKPRNRIPFALPKYWKKAKETPFHGPSVGGKREGKKTVLGLGRKKNKLHGWGHREQGCVPRK